MATQLHSGDYELVLDVISQTIARADVAPDVLAASLMGVMDVSRLTSHVIDYAAGRNEVAYWPQVPDASN